MYALIAVALSFLLTIILSIYNFTSIRNLSAENDTNQDETELKLDEQASNIRDQIADLKDEMSNNKKRQKQIDSKQNKNIDSNQDQIFDLKSNIEFNIEPQLVVFDGNFKSLDSAIAENVGTLAELQEQVSIFNSDQLNWNEQFSNQQGNLASKLDEIQTKDYDEKIKNINKKITDDLIPNVKFNAQSLANLSNKVEGDLVNDLDDLSNKYMTLSSNAHELSVQTLRLADVVDDHDLFIKST